MATLALWAILGFVHTGMSFVRKGFPPNQPPSVGTEVPANVSDITALHRLVQPLDGGRLLVLLPANADTGNVIYYRYQLAYIDYPLRVFARRLNHSIEMEVAQDSLVVTPRGTRMPAGWQHVGDQADFALFRRIPR
jgi:hypothetical protein